MEKGGIIKNLIIIVAIIAMVFLSQQLYFGFVGKNISMQAQKQLDPYWTIASKWFTVNIYSKVSGGVSNFQSFIAKEITQQKNIFAQRVWDRLKGYFAPKFSDITGTPVK